MSGAGALLQRAAAQLSQDTHLASLEDSCQKNFASLESFCLLAVPRFSICLLLLGRQICRLQLFVPDQLLVAGGAMDSDVKDSAVNCGL